MRWVEIINARMAANTESLELERTFRVIRNSAMEGAEQDTRMVIYRGRFIDIDLSIHLHRESHDLPSGRTRLGMELADMIRPMALVDHSIWIEEE